MKKYFIGGLIGLAIIPGIIILLIVVKFGIEPAYKHFFLDLPNEQEEYKKMPSSYFAKYNVEAPFIVPHSSIIRDGHPFGIYKNVPVQVWEKEDFTSICMHALSEETFDVAFILSPLARHNLLASLRQTQNQTPFQFSNDGYATRYYINVDDERLAGLWAAGLGAVAYETAITDTPELPDFIIQAPYGQLYNFLTSILGLLDAPVQGCTPDVDPTDIPVWEELVVPIWPTANSR